MELSDKKIGYWPYRSDYSGPGDRRRFIFYANTKKLNYELASIDKCYDVVYLTMGCDISQWIKYKKRYPHIKIVFEIVDSYFLEGFNFFSFFRGLIKFIIGKETKLYLNYNRAIVNMFMIADTVVCSTQIQKNFILKYNNNVHISLDYFLQDITHFKINYSSNKRLKIVWEGQAYTVKNLLKINKVFKKLGNKIELHIIADPVINYPFKIFNKKTTKILSKIHCQHFFYVWEKHSFSQIIAEADLAIIPIERSDKLHWNKPENKLLLFWQIGIPVLTSPTPAYTNTMKKAGLPCLCDSTQEWVDKIESYIKMNDEQKKQWMQRADGYLQNNHRKDMIIKKWDEIFISLFE